MKKTLIYLILFILSSFLFNDIVLSWDDKVTHRDLSEFAAESSVLSEGKGNYLRNLGFEKGLDERVKWDTTELNVRKWLRDGAMLEDSAGPKDKGYADGKGRSFNHFHNTLKAWNEAGLDDWIGSFHFTGKSSLLSAQDGAYQEDFYEGNWSGAGMVLGHLRLERRGLIVISREINQGIIFERS